VSYAGLCRVCNSDPVWRVERRGDAAVSWACDEDLYAVCQNLQRGWEITELVVTNAVKQREWNEISGTLAGEDRASWLPDLTDTNLTDLIAGDNPILAAAAERVRRELLDGAEPVAGFQSGMP
jgi:FXSXX-COOH protein